MTAVAKTKEELAALAKGGRDAIIAAACKGELTEKDVKAALALLDGKPAIRLGPSGTIGCGRVWLYPSEWGPVANAIEDVLAFMESKPIAYLPKKAKDARSPARVSLLVRPSNGKGDNPILAKGDGPEGSEDDPILEFIEANGLEMSAIHGIDKLGASNGDDDE